MQHNKDLQNIDLTADLDLLEFAHLIGCQELHFKVDQASGLKAIVAIYSTKLGPALGGCRFLVYPSTQLAAVDAMLLAKSMAIKSALADLPLGGGKAVLIQSPVGNSKIHNLGSTDLNINSVKRKEIFTAFGEFLNTLSGRYITAVDSGTTVADMDLISTVTKFVTSTSKFCYKIADPSVATAYGVWQGILAAVKFKFGLNDLREVRVSIQGVGNVGYNLVKLLHAAKASITICDHNKQALANCVANFPEIKVVAPDQIYNIPTEIFAPCALGGVLNLASLEQLSTAIIAGAANNQLAIDVTPENLQQLGILYIPDFVINAGGVIYVAGPILQQTEVENMQHIDQIYNRVLNICQQAVKGLSTPYQVAYNLALKKLKIL